VYQTSSRQTVMCSHVLSYIYKSHLFSLRFYSSFLLPPFACPSPTTVCSNNLLTRHDDIIYYKEDLTTTTILLEDARRTVNNQDAQLPVRRLEHNEHFRATRLGARCAQCNNSTLGHCLLISLSSINTLVSTRVMYR
jgi:hypothetical protein